MRSLFFAFIGAFVATSAWAALSDVDVTTIRALMDNAIQAKMIRDVPTNKVDQIIITINGTDPGGKKSASINITPSDTEFANALSAIKTVAGRRVTAYVDQIQALGVTVTP